MSKGEDAKKDEQMSKEIGGQENIKVNCEVRRDEDEDEDGR